MLTQEYYVDLVPRGEPLVVHVSQYDKDSRNLVFNLHKAGIAFTPPVGSTAKLSGTKPDNHGFEYSMTITGSKASISLPQQVAVVAGDVKAEIVIEDSGDILGTANFIIEVEPAALKDDAIMSDTEIPIVRAFIMGGTDGQIFVHDSGDSGSWENYDPSIEWGDIGGTLSDQTDLQNALNGKVDTSKVGVANGVASLDSAGKVPSGQLPGYVDDVEEYSSLSAFPNPGEAGKIYVAIDTSFTYRWSGSTYIKIGNPVEFDATPTVGSSNAVTSNGIALALQGKQNTLTFDNAPILNSGNPVTSDGIFVDQKRQDDAIDTLAMLIAAKHSGDFKVIQTMVQMGYGPTLYPVGTQFSTTHATYGTIVWDVLHHITPQSSAVYKSMLPEGVEYGMVIAMDRVIYSTQIDSEEALCYAAELMPAGTYVFRISSAWSQAAAGYYKFTTSVDIPVGGQVGPIVSIADTAPANWKVNTYASGDTTTALESNIPVVSAVDETEGTYLGNISSPSGVVNHIQRIGYGSNDYAESAMRQWINSDDASDWWEPKTDWDRPCNYISRPGFLYGFDSTFKNAILETNHANRSNEVFDSHGKKQAYSTTDKMFLLSNEEVGFASESGITCGALFDYYVDATNADRIKYDISDGVTARTWFLRTPYPSIADNERLVTSSGVLVNNGSRYGFGAVAACVIG